MTLTASQSQIHTQRVPSGWDTSGTCATSSRPCEHPLTRTTTRYASAGPQADDLPQHPLDCGTTRLVTIGGRDGHVPVSCCWWLIRMGLAMRSIASKDQLLTCMHSCPGGDINQLPVIFVPEHSLLEAAAEQDTRRGFWLPAAARTAPAGRENVSQCCPQEASPLLA